MFLKLSRLPAVAIVIVVVATAAWQADSQAGSITGQGRFEMIAGNPAAGYKNLYEWDLFVSPENNAIVGPSRRLGAPPGQVSRGDGFYQIDGLPAGSYSAYVNQPDFFAAPKVVPNVQIGAGQTHLDVELDVDYSTYERKVWTGWEWDLFQTFVATGTSIRGVSWVMAGAGLYNGKQAKITILEDNGNANPTKWTPIGTATDGQLSSDSDEWVRWTSGEVPTTPGKRYAVKVNVNGGMAIYKRDKDAQSYTQGQAYDKDGNPRNYDLNITVFTDRDQIVTHTTKSSGPGRFLNGLSSTRWGQTFVATGRALAAVDLFAASGQPDIELSWRILLGGPGGRQIGSTKTTRGAYFASSTDLIGVSFNPQEVPLVPGEIYYIETGNNTHPFTPYAMQSWEPYGDGRAYRNGVPTGYDMSMTIVEYSPATVPEPATITMLAVMASALVCFSYLRTPEKRRGWLRKDSRPS